MLYGVKESCSPELLLVREEKSLAASNWKTSKIMTSLSELLSRIKT